MPDRYLLILFGVLLLFFARAAPSFGNDTAPSALSFGNRPIEAAEDIWTDTAPLHPETETPHPLSFLAQPAMIPHRVVERVAERVAERAAEKAASKSVHSSSIYALPGLDFRDAATLNAEIPSDFTGSVGNRVFHDQFGGSLELAAVRQRYVPAIYVEGEGYLPISHPAISPYFDAQSASPENNPYIVMVPEARLAGWSESTFVPSDQDRMVDTSGSTVLNLPRRRNIDPITISAQSGWTKQTKDYDIYFLEGDCCIRQGRNAVQGPQAVVWVARTESDALKDTLKNSPQQNLLKNSSTVGAMDGPREVTVYLESSSSSKPLTLEFGSDQEVDANIHDKQWFGRFVTRTSVQTMVVKTEPTKSTEPGIYRRAMEMMSPDYSVIQQAQFVVESKAVSSSSSQAPRFRRITLNSRGDNDNMHIQFDSYPNNPDRGILVISKGLNLVIEGVTDQELLLGNVVDISADHAVIWSHNPTKIRRNTDTREDSNLDFEVYLEGNIIFRDGERLIEANRMYYDAKNRIAYILDGSLSTPLIGIKNISGSMRVKAEILQQLGDGMFSAKNTVITTSRLGEPSYSLRSRSMTLTERPGTPLWGGDEQINRQILVAENNYLAARTFPIFYWPWMAADLRDPTFYIKNITYGNSSVYGNQVRTTWNPFQILNIRNRPDWLDGELKVSWLEKRGIGHGVDGTYSPPSFCSFQGPTQGRVSVWGIYDKGTGDRLGGGRSNVPFPQKYRYRVAWKHQQELESLFNCKGPWTFTGQVGKVSDRNFLNSYSSGHWNTSDNDTTSIHLKKTGVSSTTSIFTEYALDDFYTNANQIPRLDHYLLGKSLLQDRLTLYGHTKVGYVDYNTANSPYATDRATWNQDARYFLYLPWELTTNSPTSAPARPWVPGDPTPQTINSSFETFSTRHELDLPFNVGPVRCVPYVMGDFSHWGTNRGGQGVQRWYGQTGVRLNLPFWQMKPNCSSRTWYVNGLAHKIDLDGEFSYARADHNMDDLILTDALDNWSIEDFRRRYSVTTFGLTNGAVPLRFDPRYYALRSGLAGNVTASNMEIADDLTLCRVGLTQRWQTKRGSAGKRYIIDWITLATHFNYYPEKTKDNYGESIGLIDYDFLWHVGDRFSLFSSGLYDTFEEGQQITRLGGVWQRPERGNVSVMLDQLGGAINRTYLTFGVGYTMNEKYSLNYSTSYDIKDRWQNVGHNFGFTRTGEAFRMMIGASYSEAKEEWSFTFGLEPVFMRGIASRMQKAATTLQTNLQ